MHYGSILKIYDVKRSYLPQKKKPCVGFYIYSNVLIYSLNSLNFKRFTNTSLQKPMLRNQDRCITYNLDRCRHVQQEQNRSCCFQTRRFDVVSTVFLSMPLSIPRIVCHKNKESYKHLMLLTPSFMFGATEDDGLI